MHTPTSSPRHLVCHRPDRVTTGYTSRPRPSWWLYDRTDTCSCRKMRRSHAATGDHPRQHLAVFGPCPACQEGRCDMAFLRRLQGAEHGDRERQVPHSGRRGAPRRAARCQVLHQARSVVRLPPSARASQRCGQDGVPDTPRPIRVPRHAVRPPERAVDVPGAHELHPQAVPPPVRPCFFDDILIYSVSWTANLQQLRAVLDTLRAHHLHIKRS